MTFSGALVILKDGGFVRRKGWNGKGMWIKIIRAGNACCGSLEMQDCIGMKTASPRGEMQPGWLASQADLLANDWEEVVE
jgi:Protein of unknown function (DUF2829)